MSQQFRPAVHQVTGAGGPPQCMTVYPPTVL